MADYTPGSTLGTPSTGGTNTQGLADWAAPYITNYLGQAQALSNQPYQTYQGPLTAGPSALQQNVFQGLAGLSIPSNLGQSFTGTGAPTAGLTADGTANLGTGSVAGNYMNPYLQAVLDPQLAELRRQNDITNMQANAKLTGAGAYGGGRQAIMNAENNRNLMTEMNKTVGQGYANAYDKAMQQFNTEQARQQAAAKQAQDYGLAGLGAQATAGATQRDIEQQGVAADIAQFQEERDYPYKQIQYMQSLLQGLPVAAQSATYQQPSGLTTLLGGAGGVLGLLKQLGYGGTTPSNTPASGALTSQGKSYIDYLNSLFSN